MNVVAIVANLEKEKDYYKQQLEETRTVIKQLTEGVKPGEVEYIHPYDFAEMINSVSMISIIDVGVARGYIDVFEDPNGKKYKQSPLIPAKSKNFK